MAMKPTCILGNKNSAVGSERSNRMNTFITFWKLSRELMII